MQLSKLPKFILWLAGTLIVGALGNGLWEIAKPALLWLSSASLDVATFGLSSLRDGIYEEIARGTYERAGEMVLSIFIGIGTSVPLVILSASLLIAKVRISERTFTPASSFVSTPTPATMPATAPASARNTLRRLATVSVLLSLAIALLISNFRMIYIIRAANHMEQLQRVVAPFVPDQQRLLFASRFAAMHTRDQYVSLITELTDIAHRNNARVPVFNVY